MLLKAAAGVVLRAARGRHAQAMPDVVEVVLAHEGQDLIDPAAGLAAAAAAVGVARPGHAPAAGREVAVLLHVGVAATPICWRLFLQTAKRPASRTDWTAGRAGR